ncbi:MAG: TlpA family protein disulfide reductase [Sulfuricella sp.]|nr:TlpA family protein disulfide reductase [Sulfuricella sp.]
MKRLFVALLCLCAWSAHAAPDIQPFVRGSAKQIAAAHPGKPYILAFWSLTCSHCREELGQLGELLQKNPGVAVVVVSTDSPAEVGEIAAVLAENRLQGAQAWGFADSFVERLRADVDRKWRGELPRTYLFDAAHQAVAHSGKLRPEQLAAWLK